MAETEDPGDIRPLPESHHGGGGGGGVNLGGIPPGHQPPPGFGGVMGYGGWYTPSRLADILGQRRKLMQSYGVQGPAVSTSSPAGMGFSVASPGTSFAAPAQGPYGGPQPAGPASPSGGPYGGGMGNAGGSSGPYAGTDQRTINAWIQRLQYLQTLAGNRQLDRRGQMEVQELAGRLHSLGLSDAGKPTGPGPGGSLDEMGYDAFLHDPRNDVAGLINRLVGSGGFAGAFDPMGSPAVMQAVQQRAESEAARNNAQAQRAAQYYAGSDPAAAGYAGLQSYLGGLGNTANAVNNARLQTMLQGQQYSRDLLSSMLGADVQQKLQRLANDRQQQGTDWGAIGGGILGSAFGGLGAGVGAGIGRAIG